MALLNRQSASDRLTVRYVAALSAVALLLILSQALVQRMLMQQSSDAHVINLAGRQRMLSQKLSKTALAFESAAAPDARKERVEELRSVVTLWERSHVGLQRGDAELGLPGTNSAEVTRLFTRIEPHYQSMLHAAKRLIAAVTQEAADSSGRLHRSMLVEEILAEEAAFLEGMSEIVFQYDQEAEARINGLKQIELVLFSTTLIVLLLIGLFLFRPTARRIRQNIWELEQTKEALRKAYDGLEAQVGERTSELAATNQQLETELAERQRAEEALRKSEERFRRIFDDSQVGMTVTIGGAKFLQANQAFLDMLGYTQEELLGMNMSEVIHPDDWKDHLPVAEQVLKGELDFFQIEARYLHKQGHEIWSLTSVSVIRDSTGKILFSLGQYIDLTERRKLEEQFQQAQKMEAVGRLAGGVAHDFNNLLMVMRGYTELMLGRLSANDPLRSNAEEIQKAADRATSLTQQLLAFSRKQVMQPKVFDLNAVVAETEKMLRRLIGEDIELATLLGAELGRVKADPGQIEQVILNLAVNARDAMPQGGKLVLETANVELTQTFARQHPGVTPGPHVMLAMSDTGVGMDAETQARIFEPFFTTKEKGKGTGLGLATVYGIVKQSGGYIWVYSEPGQGATFEIYLPQVEEGVEAVGPDKALAAPAPGSETILLVEDEAPVRKLARGFLESSGYTVLEAKDGVEAIQLAQQHSGPIHLMVTDVVMPQMSGDQLIERMAQLRPEMKVLCMSGYTDEALIHHGMLDQGISLLQKPFSLDVLARTVRKVLNARRNSLATSTEQATGIPR
jgi:PAS domain S-box-containing protein